MKYQIIKVLQESNIVVAALPVHTSQVLQLLDCDVFGPLKDTFCDLLSRRTVTKTKESSQFVSLWQLRVVKQFPPLTSHLDFELKVYRTWTLRMPVLMLYRPKRTRHLEILPSCKMQLKQQGVRQHFSLNPLSTSENVMLPPPSLQVDTCTVRKVQPVRLSGRPTTSYW